LGEAEETNFARAKQIQAEMRDLAGGGILASTAEVVAQNVAQAREVVGAGLVGGAAGSVIPGIGTMTGFAGGLGTGIVLTTAKMEAGNLYLDLQEQGISDDTAVPIAVGAGLLNGVVESVGMKVAAAPFRQLAVRVMREQIAEAIQKPTMRAALAAAGKAYVVQVGSEATEEGLQEIVNIAGEELAKGMEGIDSETTMRDAAKRVLDSFVQGAMGGSILGGIGPGANLYVDLRRANKATKQTRFFDDLSKNATESKLKARDAGAYERFVAATADGTGADTVFVDGATIRDVLTQAGVTDTQLDAIIPGMAQQVRQAVELGNDVTLPTSQFAARLAGTKLGDALMPHMRLSPDAMSAMEAQQFEQSREALVEEARALLDAKTEAESAFVQEADQIASSMRDRLVAAGRDPAMAEVESLVHQAFVVTQAARLGMTPSQFEAESGLREIVGVPQVRDEGMAAPTGPLEQADQFDQAGQRKTDTPQFRAWFENSKIVDENGNPLVAYRAMQGRTVLMGGDAGLAFAALDEANVQQWTEGGTRPVRKVYVSAQNPFDFRDPDMQDLLADMVIQPKFVEEYNRRLRESGAGDSWQATPEDLEYQARVGAWQLLETPMVVEILRREGYDAMFVVEDEGQRVPNIAVFSDNQFKSIDNRGTFSRATANIMDQAATLDAEYLAAVERGDTATAQRMVDEAARAAGYNETGFHGLGEGVLEGSTFDVNRRGKKTGAKSAQMGFFFASQKTAETYAAQMPVDSELRQISRAAARVAREFIDSIPAKYRNQIRPSLSILQEQLDRGEEAFMPDGDLYNVDINSPASFVVQVMDDLYESFPELIGDVLDVWPGDSKAKREWASKTRLKYLREFDPELARLFKEGKGQKPVLFDAKLKMQNPLIVDFKGKETRPETYADIIRRAIKNGHDSAIIRNTYDTMRGEPVLDDIKVVFDPAQIKSAEPVTRDEQG
ncbi:MAG: hypothetical protein ACOYNN_15570, partial [Terrimicrobiaceae bacterium]